jgi:hypothetical protein
LNGEKRPVGTLAEMATSAGDAPASHRRERARIACATMVGAALLLAAGVGRCAGAPGPDTIGVRIETGAGTDITNEQYYEDAFIDTTFLRVSDHREHPDRTIVNSNIGAS